MRYLHTFISLALVAGLGYSQCTGGMFAIPIALAADFNFQQEIAEEDGSLMSKDITACFDDFMTHALEEDHEKDDHVEQGHESGCGDGAPCVRQTQQVLTIILSSSATGDGNALYANTSDDVALDVFAHDRLTFRARAGPLYAFAYEAAHVLVKKE